MDNDGDEILKRPDAPDAQEIGTKSQGGIEKWLDDIHSCKADP